MSLAATFPPIFDGHNDTITGTGPERRQALGPRWFLERSERGCIDLPRAREGGLGGGLFAVFTRGSASPVTHEETQAQALDGLGSLFELERASDGQCRIVTTAAELQDCLDAGIFAVVLHLEGAYPLDPGGRALDVFVRAGLRSVGIAHFQPNVYAVGVPRRFPSTPDIGPGLTEPGKELVRQCNRLRVLVDVSHANERTFWDVAAITDAPLVATHSNAWGLAHSSRNLTDPQLDAIRDSHGLVGLSFHAGFLRSDGERDVDTPLAVIVDHVEYLVERLGIDGVGFGSDFDGAPIPADLRDAAGLPKVMQALADRGYHAEALRQLAHGNWVRVLHETWGS